MDIVKLSLDKSHNLNLFVGNDILWTIMILILFFIIGFFILLFFKNKNALAMLLRGHISMEGAKLGLNGFAIDIKPNYQTVQVAYKLWVELNTRKLGLRIDLENDVIEEIYNSWYAFFEVTRELIKEIPAQEALNKDTKQLITIATDVLNKGVRPHLTKWQARFRNWYDVQKKVAETNGFSPSPQKVQMDFRCSESEFCYDELSSDLLKVNEQLIEYKNLLEKIVFNLK